MADGGGSIGGGSIYAKFHVGSEEDPISEVELNDKAETTTLTLTFPHTVDMSKAVKDHTITVTTEQLKVTPIKIEWIHKAGQTYQASAQSAR